MDFIEHARAMIPTLSGLAVTVWESNNAILKDFERKFCFLPETQTLYTVKGLLSFFERKDGSHIYMVTDALDTHVVIIKIDAQWIILGPYVTSSWEEGNAKILLASCGVGESLCLPYKLYRCEMPLLEQAYVLRIAAMLLTYTVGNAPPRELEIIRLAAKDAAGMRSYFTEQYDGIEFVNRRYALEDQIVEAVRQGKPDEALRRRREMRLLVPGLRYTTNDLSDQIAGSAILRTLVRRAALQAGLTPVLIDSISQEFAQKMHRAVDERQLDTLEEQLILAFCHAVRANNQNSYSIYVKRAIQYIESHLSQPISVDTLCQLSNISRKHFVQLFSKETGKTVKQYIMHVRCERAAELLENSQLLVQEISNFVGYEDNNYFSKIFKSVMGLSPQEYRKMKSFY